MPRGADPAGDGVELVPAEQRAEVRHRHQDVLDLPGVLGRRHRAGVVGRDLVAEEVEVHPGVGAAAFAAAEDLAVEPAGGVEIADEEGEVEGWTSDRDFSPRLPQRRVEDGPEVDDPAEQEPSKAPRRARTSPPARIEPPLNQLPQAGDEETGERGDHVARRALTSHVHLTFRGEEGAVAPGMKGYILQRMSRQSPRFPPWPP